MYVRAEDWRAAHRVAVGCMPPDDIRELYVAQVPSLSWLLPCASILQCLKRSRLKLSAKRHSRQLLCDFFKSIHGRVLC